MPTLKPFSRAYIVVYLAADGYRWQLKAGNGHIVADSGQAYPARRKCRDMAYRNYGDRYPIYRTPDSTPPGAYEARYAHTRDLVPYPAAGSRQAAE